MCQCACFSMKRATFALETDITTMNKDLFDFQLPDFERYTCDQQFVNVADAIIKFETKQGGLCPEEIWNYAVRLLESLKHVSRPEITVNRMFTHITSRLKEQYQDRDQQQVEHTAFVILFCANYILCANEEEPDPNQEIIDNISKMLSQMPDIVPLFEYVETMEDEQEAKGYSVEPRNVLAKPHVETQAEAAQRIMGLLKQDIISPIVNAGFVLQPYRKEIENIWEDILADDPLLALMRKDEFGKKYNLKLVLNILGVMTYNGRVITASNNKLDKMLFPNGPTHYKFFTTETEGSFSAFNSDTEQSLVKSIIARHKN